MNEELIPLLVVKNESTSRFELNVDGYIAFIDYKQEDDIIKLIHTEVPEELGGKGVAAALVEKHWFIWRNIKILCFRIVLMCMPTSKSIRNGNELFILNSRNITNCNRLTNEIITRNATR